MTIFKSLSNELYSIPKAQILFKPLGAVAFELLGDADDVTIEPTIEESERFSNEGGVRLLAKTVVTQVDATVNMTLMQLSNRNRALSLLGLLEFETQTAALAQVYLIEDVDHSDKVYQLPHIDLANVSVTDGAGAVPYVLNTHYRLDAPTGMIQFIAKPAGSDDDAEITYDGQAIVVGDKVAKFGIASQTENRGTLIIRGTNEVGPKSFVQLHDVQIRPDGGRAFISETDFSGVAVVGRVFRDENQDPGYELGFERDIT